MTNSKTNPYLLLGIGATGGLLLGRFLPVLFANASGLAQGAAQRDPFAGLIREHRLLLSLLGKNGAVAGNRLGETQVSVPGVQAYHR